jgi:hypothetical protein
MTIEAQSRYKLRRGGEIMATGRPPCEERFANGEPVTIGVHPGVARVVGPILGERELRLVVQLD